MKPGERLAALLWGDPSKKASSKGNAVRKVACNFPSAVTAFGVIIENAQPREMLSLRPTLHSLFLMTVRPSQ